VAPDFAALIRATIEPGYLLCGTLHPGYTCSTLDGCLIDYKVNNGNRSRRVEVFGHKSVNKHVTHRRIVGNFDDT
jgi:hypothetical protein